MSNERGRPRHNDILTPQEWRTVDAVRHGLTNKQIAERRGISEDAVKFHVANAIAKLGIENRKALRFWEGAPIDSNFYKGEAKMDGNVDILCVGQIARSVKDINKSTNWYSDVLGLTHLYSFENLAFFDCGGTRLMLSADGEFESKESLLYLKVPLIDLAYEQLQERGIEFINAPHMIHKHDNGVEEWMAFFNDLEKRSLAIMSTTEETL